MPVGMESGGPNSLGDRDGRREPRLAVDLSARILGRTPRLARVVDLSARGTLVRSEVALAPGAVVDLEIELPDGALRAKARVAEGTIDGDSLPGPPARFLTGLEFLGLAAADERRLRSFLRAESKRKRSAHTPPS